MIGAAMLILFFVAMSLFLNFPSIDNEKERCYHFFNIILNYLTIMNNILNIFWLESQESILAEGGKHMKLFISADIEGVCGLTDWEECSLDSPRYSAVQMTREVAAACEAALDFGIDEVIVKDAHASGRNLILKELPRQTKVVRSWSEGPLFMMEGLSEEFVGACYIGYHAAAGQNGNPLAHTISSLELVSIHLNDELASEFLLNHHMAAYLGVPSLFLSGDRQICQEAERLAPGLVSFAVKEGRGGATLNLHPDVAVEGIYQGVKKALENPAPFVRCPEKIELRIRFTHHLKAFRASYYPGAKQLSAHEVMFCGNCEEVMRAILFTV